MVRENDVYRSRLLFIVVTVFQATGLIAAYSSKSTLPVSKVPKKSKYTFSAKWWRKGAGVGIGGADWKLHKTSRPTCTSDGSGNNAEHSQGKSGNFIFDIQWQPCYYCWNVLIQEWRKHPERGVTCAHERAQTTLNPPPDWGPLRCKGLIWQWKML